MLRSTGDRVQVITTYHPVLKDLNTNLKKHIPILHTNQRMDEASKEPSKAAFRRQETSKTW